jgi:hypothetical protein
MKIYVVVRGEGRKLYQILGAYARIDDAERCCKQQPTIARRPWERFDEEPHTWHNGCGLYVKILEFDLQRGEPSVETEEKSTMPIKALVKLNTYKIIDDVVERAVLGGIRRAHKHVERPSEEHLAQEVHRYVMNELCEILNFDEDS